MPFNSKYFMHKYRRWWWKWMRQDVKRLLSQEADYIMWLEEQIARLSHDLTIAESRYRQTQIKTELLSLEDECGK